MNNPDTRLDSAIQDVKSASAALDDARVTLYDLLDGCPWETRDVLTVDYARQQINKLLPKSDAIVASLTRVLERLP